MSEGSRYRTETIGTVETSVDIIDEIMKKDGAGVTEIADEKGYPKSTTHKHLVSLVELDCIYSDERSYKLGLHLALLGEHAQRNHPLYQLSSQKVEQLAQLTNELAGCFVYVNGLGVNLNTVMSENVLKNDVTRINRKYLHCSAAGKAILSKRSNEEVRSVIWRHGLPQFTENTISSEEQLFDELNRIRERGIAFGREEQREGISSVAVPFEGPHDNLGALFVAGSQERLSGKWFEEDLAGNIASTVSKLQSEITD